jgi:hypothetical protein
VLMQYIRVDPMLLELWGKIMCDMMPLMHHIIRATRLLAMRRDINDTHSCSSTCSSSTPSIDEGGRDPSSHPPPPPSPHPDHKKETPIPPPPPSPHLDEQATPIRPPPISD